MAPSDTHGLQQALIALAPGNLGIILAWHGDEIAHEILTLGVYLDEHFANPPMAPGIWIWEGVVEPPYLPSTVEEQEEINATAVWAGRWRRPTEEELSWFGMYGRNPWKQDLS